MRRGYTLLEVLMVITILTVLATMTIEAFSKYNLSQALDKDSALVTSILAQARNLTLSSKGNVSHGVHLGSTQIILFTGSSYVVGSSTNVTYALNSNDRLTSSLQGSGSDVIFDRLTGNTSEYGTITLSNIISSSTKSITIYSTGVIEN